MKHHVISCTAFAVVTVLLSGGSAAAQERKAGDRFVYTVRVGSPSRGSQSIDSKLKIVVNRVDASGSAAVTASADYGQMKQFNGPPFDAAMSRNGAIITGKADISALAPPDLTSRKSMSKQEIAAQATAMNVTMLSMNLRGFNAFADACGARKALRIGDTWQGPSPSQMDNVVYKVTGREQHLGHDSYAVTMQSLPNASIPVSGQGYYDAAAHLVVAFHYEQKVSQDAGTVDTTLEP